MHAIFFFFFFPTLLLLLKWDGGSCLTIMNFVKLSISFFEREKARVSLSPYIVQADLQLSHIAHAGLKLKDPPAIPYQVLG